MPAAVTRQGCAVSDCTARTNAPPSESHRQKLSLPQPQPPGEAGQVPGRCATCLHTLGFLRKACKLHAAGHGKSATESANALYEVCHMPQVARGTAVPGPISKVEHGSCAVALHCQYFTSVPYSSVLFQQALLLRHCVSASIVIASAESTKNSHAVSKHYCQCIWQGPQHHSVEGASRTAVLAALLFKPVTSCDNRHRMRLDMFPVLAGASAGGLGAEDC